MAVFKTEGNDTSLLSYSGIKNECGTRVDRVGDASIVVMVAGAMIWKLDLTFAVISSLLIIMYSVTIGYRLWMIRQGTDIPAESLSTSDELASLDDRDLPVYTILVPAREEAAVLPALTKALDELDYPKDRLDVKLLLEEDDDETIHAARSAHLPSFIDIVIVPADNPRTKPKACNYGLLRARGEYVTIFDAEDIPEPLQLKKAILAFRKHDDKLACVQAKLSYFNANQNLLTRWFTAEYASWFDLFLPSLYAAKLPIPLGGTSNHFRTDRLRELGGWDPYNVTEDADLGIRLYKAGYYASVIDSNTYEEANSEFVNWVRQRSRWIKGYIQTWLVHMRHPLKLYQSMGPRGFWGFQMSILGTPLMFLLNPLYWFLTSLWFMTNWHIIPSLFPPGIYYLGMINLLGGNFIFTYINALGAAKHGNWDLVPYTLLTPIYWSMMSLASWKALVQLITRPSHWEKTIHGLSAPHQLPPIANAAPVQESTM
ncbi:MAG: glycosyltransferase [Firmicutes bacterium]|nr:glycosyltransferase [Bacillota bacterium]